MTLIVKELVIRGIVSRDYSSTKESSFDEEKILQYLEQLKRDIEKECEERILQKLETKTLR